jgi:tetratricopeptide (TPR) repeat protein
MPQVERASDDDRFMSLVITALAQPPGEREAWLRRECGGDSPLFDQAREYIESEERMGGFLLEPFCTLELFEPALEPGELLEDRFRIIREVGEGGMAIVYEAIDETLKKRIAIKCAKAGFQTRLTPEVRHATEITHRNVCKIFDCHSAGTDRGEIDFITMEFLDGPTLTERLRAGPLPEREARDIALQLCAGLAAAHRNHVIHGDLKSNNIILAKAADGSPRAVITDFGLARGIHPHPESVPPGASASAVGGAPDYMAPELRNGEKPSVSSDIYALGVICYEMLSGSRLRAPVAPGQERSTRKPPHVHRKWDRILASCLDPSPSRRYESVEEIQKKLGPKGIPPWALASTAAVLVVGTGIGVWNFATAPKETVKLAFSPLEGGDASLASDAAEKLARIKGNAQTRFGLLPLGKSAGATHLLHGTIRPGSGKLLLHAQLTDSRSGVDAKKWDAEYAPAQSKYIPIALAGVVTETFHLSPPMANANVNAGAQEDYQKGMAAVRWDSKMDEAIQAFQHAVNADPDSPLTYAGLAEAEWFSAAAASDQVGLARAAEAERQAEIRNPDLAPVHRMLGLLIYNSGRYDQAIVEFRRALELEPGVSDGYRRLGMAYQANNQTDEALAAYRRSVELEPAYYRNHEALGDFWFKRGNYEEAAQTWVRAVDLAPSEPRPLYELGVAYLNAGRFVEAEAQLRKSLDLKQTRWTLARIGHSLMYQRREQEAIPYFVQALGLGPEDYESWTYLGIAYRRATFLARSKWANLKGLKFAEEDAARNLRKGSAHHYLAYLCARLGQRHRAQSEILEALRLTPSDSNTIWMAALTYEALGLHEKTIEVLEKAPHAVLADLSRWPDVADLDKNPRFLQLLGAQQNQ